MCYKQISGKTVKKRVRKDTKIEYVVNVDYIVHFSENDPKKCKEFDFVVDDEGNVVKLEFFRKFIINLFYLLILYLVANWSTVEEKVGNIINRNASSGVTIGAGDPCTGFAVTVDDINGKSKSFAVKCPYGSKKGLKSTSIRNQTLNGKTTVIFQVFCYGCGYCQNNMRGNVKVRI